jgi:[ribosomal protein S5]-alanine N-acetyltransferase
METYLQSPRLYFREVRKTDVTDNYYYWLNDGEVNQFLETRFMPRSKENILEYVEKFSCKENEPFFAMCLKKSSRHIGNIKLGPINWYHRSADISLLIGEKDCWRKGYASEAIDLITKFAFLSLGLNKLKAGSYVENIGSIKAFERVGYQREGLLKGAVFSKGKETDIVLLGLRKKEYHDVGDSK